MLTSGKKELYVSLLAMMAFVLPASAHAVELNTSSLYADSGQSYHACTVTNVSTASVTFKTQIINAGGSVIATSGVSFITIAAGTSFEVSTNETYTGFAYCRINLPNEAGTTVRANLVVFHGTGAFFETLALSEAR